MQMIAERADALIAVDCHEHDLVLVHRLSRHAVQLHDRHRAARAFRRPEICGTDKPAVSCGAFSATESRPDHQCPSAAKRRRPELQRRPWAGTRPGARPSHSRSPAEAARAAAAEQSTSLRTPPAQFSHPVPHPHDGRVRQRFVCERGSELYGRTVPSTISFPCPSA